MRGRGTRGHAYGPLSVACNVGYGNGSRLANQPLGILTCNYPSLLTTDFIINLIPADLILKVRNSGFIINQQQLDTTHLSINT